MKSKSQPAYKIKDLQTEVKRMLKDDVLEFTVNSLNGGFVAHFDVEAYKAYFSGYGSTPTKAMADLMKTIEIYID